jgi:hypothetical protein
MVKELIDYILNKVICHCSHILTTKNTEKCDIFTRNYYILVYIKDPNYDLGKYGGR